MEMTEFEICQSYALAREKNTQIVILSQLNLCDPARIREILAQHGYLTETPPQNKRYHSMIDKAVARQMVLDGKTPLEIANRFGCSRNAVYSFVKRNGLAGVTGCGPGRKQ